jgi:hypothetical protein
MSVKAGQAQVEGGGLSPPHETTAPHGALTHLVTRSLASRCRGLRKAPHSAHLRPGPPTLLISTTYPFPGGLRCRGPRRPKTVSVAMKDSPSFAVSTSADMRHPEGGLRTWRAIDYGDVPFYVDRVSQVTAGARREVADFDMPLPETTGRPVQTPADGIPALLVCSPSPKDRHVVSMGPQQFVWVRVAVDEPLDGTTALIRELVPSRHPASPPAPLIPVRESILP